MTIFFSSDLHFDHNNIIAYTNRPFTDVEEMNAAIIKNFRDTLSFGDVLYVLGDVSMGKDKTERCKEFLKELPGVEVHLVCGNHDLSDKELLREIGFASVSDYKELKISKKKRAVLSHYPMLSWNGSCHGTYMLHGHIHSTGEYNEDNFIDGIRRYDVGVDANGYKPVSFEEIEEFFSESNESDPSDTEYGYGIYAAGGYSSKNTAEEDNIQEFGGELDFVEGRKFDWKRR